MKYAEANTVYGVNKARLIKRIAALCLDFVIFALIAVGIATLFSSIMNYDSYREKLDAKYEYYGVYAEVDPTKPAEEQSGMIFCEVKEEGDACYVAWDLFYKDEEATTLLHTCTNITLSTVAIGMLGATLITYFFVPLILKNGQTIGKKIMRIALINREGIRVRNINLFIRALFGVYVVELMVPFYCIVYILSGSPGALFTLAILLGILLADVFLVIGTRYGMSIHDLIGKTIVVEFDGQAIFDTIEELEEFKKKEKQKNIEYAKKKGY